MRIYRISPRIAAPQMLAPAQLPRQYQDWNEIHGAPYGRRIPQWKRMLLAKVSLDRARGSFAFQSNNSTRQFEYPWAFDAGRLLPGMRVVEIGGGLSGFQFALDRHGCSVVNVDPGMSQVGWPCDQERIQMLNRIFAAHVELRNTTIQQACLVECSFDRAFSISVIEHLPRQEAVETMRQVHRCLKKDGLFILTIDLFLNTYPFCSQQVNKFGCNQNIRDLVDDDAWEMVVGDYAGLYGFREFSVDFILSHLDEYLIGSYPSLTQCLALKKR
jgi:2-polyprenyl-3-methyl-5-hydroxy-6-metoxy-1,4-benzoquinol methylase